MVTVMLHYMLQYSTGGGQEGNVGEYNVTMTPATNGVELHGSPDRGWALNDPSGNFQSFTIRY